MRRGDRTLQESLPTIINMTNTLFMIIVDVGIGFLGKVMLWLKTLVTKDQLSVFFLLGEGVYIQTWDNLLSQNLGSGG